MNFTPGDKILIFALAAFNIFLFLQTGFSRTGGDWVAIEVDQKEVSRHSLHENRIVDVEGRLGITKVEIEGGKTRILKSPCNNKICIKSGYIRYADRISACIPNRVVVRIIGKNNRGLDTVVG